MSLLADEDFDLLLIGHTISGQSAREYADLFRARNPNGKVVAITESAFLMVKADKTVRAINGPELLLETIDEVLGSDSK